MSHKIIYLFLLLFCAIGAKAQLSQGGIPYSAHLFDYLKNPIKEKTISKVPFVRMPIVNNAQLAEKYAEANNNDGVFTFATSFECNIDIKKRGVADSLRSGILYRCAIESPTAYSLSVIFDKFRIPDGAKLFLYDDNYKQLLGAYTSNNNKPYKTFAIAPIFAEKVVIEYFEPYFPTFIGEVHIGRVCHGFIDISEQNSKSILCEVDINCSEGASWQTEKHAVCRILRNGTGLCSGSLINNTSFDGAPYFLTACHCVPVNYDATNCVFYFNYEHTTCEGTVIAHISQTISGASLLTTSYSTDFSLLELSEMPNATYAPFWAGWDRNEEQGPGCVGIHHPLSHTKKISTFDNAPITAICPYIQSAGHDDEDFYLVEKWKETEHGYSITKNGSSGSPLFNNKHRIIGQLLGRCTENEPGCIAPESNTAVYGKLSHSWDSYDINATTRLKDWLDPINKNPMTLDGLNCCSNDAILNVNIVHQPESISGLTYMHSRGYIKSAATVLAGAKVSYMASDYIELLPSFNVEQGAEFKAEIMSTLCQTSAPISLQNWADEVTTESTIEFNVVHATRYDIQVYTASGEKILVTNDTIIDNNVIIKLPQQRTDSSYLMTIAFYNNHERISNSYILTSAASRNKTRRIASCINEEVSDATTLDMTISPNPAIDVLRVDVYAENYTPYAITIHDLKGNVVSSCSHVNAISVNLNIGELPAGEYIAQISMGGRRVAKKFFKKDV